MPDANKVLAEFGIKRTSTETDWMVSRIEKDKVVLETKRIERDLLNRNMPDLRGMVIQDAIYLLETYGLVVEIQGRGSVIFQSIPKGERFVKGAIIKLELS